MNKQDLEQKVYEEYEKRHPEQIHSDFMLYEDGDLSEIEEIEFDILKALNIDLDDDIEMG